MISSLVRHVLYPLHEGLQGRRTFRFLREMECTQWLSPEGVRDYQRRKLKALVAHAARTVPFYQRLFKDIGLDPARFTLADFQRIPVMEKEIFKENEADILATEYPGKLVRLRTGSSTGSPLWFYSSTHTQALQNAAKLRCRRWWGIEPGDMMFEFWASPIELSRRALVHIAKDRHLMNHYLLSALNMTEEVMAGYIGLMNRKKPRVIVGYPSALHLLAQHLEAGGKRLRFSPKGVVATAEMLLPAQREAIQRAFGAPVINEYGARDGGLIAYECPEGSMHVVAENVFLEVDPATSPDGDPSRGDVLVTNLESLAYPFIRYRVGDQVTLSSKVCACGRGLPCLERIEGRKTDWLMDSTGKRIHGLVVAHTIAKVQGIRQFQIVQKTPTELIVRVVKNGLYRDSDDAWIIQSLAKYFTGPVHIRLMPVEHIEASQSGKHRFIINEVACRCSGILKDSKPEGIADSNL
jgi:phenylacetate-CoA ligase